MTAETGTYIERSSFARRSTAFEDSPWSAAETLLAAHPEPIYFGSGSPAFEAQPTERLQWAAEKAWAESGDALGYGELAGYLPLRELIVERMKTRGIEANVDDVLVTNGSQQGIDLIAKLLLDPGDQIIVEGPTYIGAMQTFDAYEADYLVCPVDEHGLCVDSLETLLARADVSPKLLYTVPTFQNPTGYSLAADRRERLFDLCRQRGIVIVEDDPYGDLYYDDPPEPALRSEDDQVVYLGTFSKTIAPGIRVGWMLAPPEQVQLLLMAKEGVDVHSNRITTRTVYFAAQDFLGGHIEDVRGIYRSRRDALVSTLDATMPPEVRFAHPGGGFFMWGELPQGMLSFEFLRQSAEHGVAFLPGEWFYPNGAKQTNGFRLNFSSLPADQIEIGAARLAKAAVDFIGNESGQ